MGESVGLTGAIEQISPELAATYLEKNMQNRHLRQHHVRRLAAAMRRGEWALSGEAIKLTRDGVLIDGQHRLQAVIESGVTVPFLGLRNLGENVRFVIDTGQSRGVGDELGVLGFENGKVLGNAATWKWRYETFGVSGMWRTGGEFTVTTPAAIDTIERFPGLRAALCVVSMLKPKTLISHGLAVWLYSEMAAVNASDAEAFWYAVGRGEALVEGDPPLTLRNLYLAGREATRNLTPYYRTFMAIKAWAAYRSGARLKHLRILPNETFPSFTRIYTTTDTGEVQQAYDKPPRKGTLAKRPTPVTSEADSIFSDAR